MYVVSGLFLGSRLRNVMVQITLNGTCYPLVRKLLKGPLRSPVSYRCRRYHDDRSSTLRRVFRGPGSQGQDQSSYQTIFFLNGMNSEATFCWSPTVGAKTGGLRELQTTIQTIFWHRCSPHLSSAIDLDGPVGCSPSHACYPTLFLLTWAFSL